MSSFLDKLKGKIDEEAVEEAEAAGRDEKKEKQPAGFLQLDVDIFQTPSEIIIIGLVPGVDIQNLDITIENENDIITIQGKRNQPELNLSEADLKYLRNELQWGNFYRQIILPQEINIAEIEAKVAKGILILRLPLLRLQTKGKKKIAVKTDLRSS